MPRCVRNFWIEVTIDGQTTVLSGGPKSKDGGMKIRLLQRYDGEITEAVNIDCRSTAGEMLTTSVNIEGQEETKYVETWR